MDFDLAQKPLFSTDHMPLMRLGREPLCVTAQKHQIMGNPEIITLQIIAGGLGTTIANLMKGLSLVVEL